jgi:hypothetical protein
MAMSDGKTAGEQKRVRPPVASPRLAGRRIAEGMTVAKVVAAYSGRLTARGLHLALGVKLGWRGHCRRTTWRHA